MIKISPDKIKMWSQIGSRATFGLAVLEIASQEKNLMVMTSDVSTSAGLARFKKQHPEKYLDVGISEQNLIGVAAGLSSEGYNVITTTFSPFQVLRCCEQIKVNLGYMRIKVCLTGIASGVVLGNLGYTHCSIEDIAVLRSIPNITILSPADCTETAKAVESMIKHENSVYLRLTGGSNNPIVYKEDYNFEIGKSIKLREGEDCTIFATGTMVSASLKAAEILTKKNINAEVINIHTIKPIDKLQIENSAQKNKIMFSIEEHSIHGGLGSAIAEVLVEQNTRPKLIKIGLKDGYDIEGEYEFILKQNCLTPDLIAERVLKEQIDSNQSS
jgi:transketolase